MTTLQRAKKQGRKFLNPVDTQVGGPGMIWKLLPMYFSNKEERVPTVPLGPFRTDSSIYEEPSRTGLRITWLGHSSMLIEIDGLRVLVDPVWDERASPSKWFGPKRFFSPPLRLEDVPEIDVVLISHDHYDHLARMTVERLSQLGTVASARWIAPLWVGESLQKFGVRAERISELDWTESLVVHSANGAGELAITAIPARHFSGRTLANRFETLWSSFVLRGGKQAIYYGADSGMWEGFSEIGRAYGPFNLAMLEIGAFNELWRDIHMGPDGAAKAFIDLGGGGLLMPIHWGLFDLALHGWRQPIERLFEAADQRSIKLWSPEPGLPTEVVFGEELRSPWWHASR